MRIIDASGVKHRGLRGESEEYLRGYRDAMDKYKAAPTIIDHITLLDPSDDDYIIVTYDMMNLTTNEIKEIHDMLVGIFHDKIIAIPNKVSMKACDGNVLDMYIENMKNQK